MLGDDERGGDFHLMRKCVLVTLFRVSTVLFIFFVYMKSWRDLGYSWPVVIGMPFVALILGGLLGVAAAVIVGKVRKRKKTGRS